MDSSSPRNPRSASSPAAAAGWWERWREALQSQATPAENDDAADHGTAFGLDLSFSQRIDPGTTPSR
jgi:hypothetical protein